MCAGCAFTCTSIGQLMCAECTGVHQGLPAHGDNDDDGTWAAREEHEAKEAAADELRYQLETQELDHADAMELVRSQGAARVAKLQAGEVSNYLDELTRHGGAEPEPEEADVWGEISPSRMYTEFDLASLQQQRAGMIGAPASVRQLPPIEWDSLPTGDSDSDSDSSPQPAPHSPAMAAPAISAITAAEQAEEDEWIRGFGDQPDAEEAEWEGAAWDEGEGEVMMRAGDGWDELDEMETANAAGSIGGPGTLERQESDDEEAPPECQGGERRYEMRYTLVHPVRRSVQLCVAGAVLREGCAATSDRVVVVAGLIHDRGLRGGDDANGKGVTMAKQYTVEYLLRALGVKHGEGVDDEMLQAMVENLPLGVLLLWLPGR